MKVCRPDPKADGYMYSSGPPILDWREMAVKDEIGNWEILWRDSKPPDTRRKRILSIAKAIDSQQSTNGQAATTGLGKEGIRRLVAAYNDTEVKAAAGSEDITSWWDHLYGARFGRLCLWSLASMCLSNNALCWFVEPGAFIPYSNPAFSFIALYLSNHLAIIKV